MLAEGSANSAAEQGGDTGPADEFLISSIRGGDSAALRVLIGRHDRLVRFTIYKLTKSRCLKDPQWLDSIASSTWAGFVRTIRREGAEPPRSVPAFLSYIARNQAISAIRRKEPEAVPLDADHVNEGLGVAADTAEPSRLVSEQEELAALRACLADLPEDDRTLSSQLVAITERRWKAAAEALGMSESTLRSKWKQILGRLRACVERKTGLPLAPGEEDRDS
jgi:RNA polymerase sigma factor (sigma-70 family)